MPNLIVAFSMLVRSWDKVSTCLENGGVIYVEKDGELAGKIVHPDLPLTTQKITASEKRVVEKKPKEIKNSVSAARAGAVDMAVVAQQPSFKALKNTRLLHNKDITDEEVMVEWALLYVDEFKALV